MSSSHDNGAGASRSLDRAAQLRPDVGGLVIAAGLVLLAVLIWWDASAYPERRSYAKFGPEIFPYIVAAGLAGFGAVTAVMAWRNQFPEREEMAIAAPAWVTLAIALEVVLLTFGAGFILGSGVLFGLCARGMGGRPVWYTVAVGIVFSALLYLLFRHGLGLSLPAGPVERLVDAPFRR